MSVFARFLVATAMALAAATTALAAPAGAGTGSWAGGLKLCVNDDMKGYCLGRQGYDTNFGNDKYCYDDGRYFDETAYGCTWAYWSTFGDETSSVRNNSGYWWKLYEHRDYGGYTLCLRPYGYDNDLGNNTPLEDEISSVKRFGTTRPSGCDKAIG